MTELTETFEVSHEFCDKYCDGKAWPLPRLGIAHVPSLDRYEVVVAGAGPAGEVPETPEHASDRHKAHFSHFCLHAMA